MAGKSTGERVPGRKYRQIVETASRGDSINLISRNVKVTWQTAKAVVERESREIAERKQELLDQSLRLARRAANRLEDELDSLPPNQVLPVYGVSVEKAAILSGDPALIIHHEHLHAHKHEHKFQAITRDKFDEILAQLPDDPEDNASQSTDSTSLDLSLLPDEQQQGTTQEAQSNATVAVPAQEHELAQDSSGMHSHSQPDSSKKAVEAADAPPLRADEKKN